MRVALLLLVCIATTLTSLKAYYEAPMKDHDMGPVVFYLSGAARQGDAREQDAIAVGPGALTYITAYLSRGELAFKPVETDEDVVKVLTETSPTSKRLWLIVDYRWPGFDLMTKDARFEEQAVPGNERRLIRLFRSRTPAADRR